MSEKTVADKFFQFLIPIWKRLYPGKTIAFSDPTSVIGNVGVVGSKNNPSISSAVKLIVEESFIWVPCPTVYEDAAAIFFDGSRKIVLPVIRLCEKTDSKENKPKYYSSDKWIEFFISEIKFKIIEAESKPKDKEERPELKLKTIAEFLKNSTPNTGLPVLAAAIAYAIFGVRKYDKKLFELNKEKIIFPEMPALHRPVDKTPLGKEVAKSVFITVGIRKNKDAPWKISTELTAEKYRFKFDINDPDFGVDPFHTPENEKIRLSGRLAVGVKIDDDKNLILPTSGKGKLHLAKSTLHLAKSTAQIPFAGNNDPRRLLMGANAQVKAVQLCKNEPPLVRTNQDNESCRPFGINLKVGYLAWQGLNHEDAWVLSKSAAEKFTCEEKKDVFIPIRSFESEPKILVEKGDEVVFNQDLIERSLNEDLLCLNDAVAKNIRQQIRRLNEKAPFKGIVTEVKIKDFLKKETVSEYFEDELIMNFKKMIIITIEGKRDLEVGDKLANRHGHKGVVGAILSDDEMPRWRGQPLEALIDPISVLNRSNWGQIFETLYGSLVKKETVFLSEGISKADWNKVKPEDCDENGRFQIDPPKSSCWMKRNVFAVAGMQFIMRMPQHASQSISASSKTDDPTLRIKEQRFGEMDCWALWAHQTDFKPKTNCELNGNAKKFQRLLFMGGYKINVNDFTRISIVSGGEPWKEYSDVSLSNEENWKEIVVLSENKFKKSFKTHSELWEELDSIEVGENRYIQIDKGDGVLDKKSLVEQINKEDNKEKKIIEYSEKYKIPKQRLKYWLWQLEKRSLDNYKPIKYICVIPKKDRPEYFDFRGEIQDHDITKSLKIILRRLSQYEKTKDPDEKNTHLLKIQIFAEELRRVAYQLAVGKSWQSNKSSVLRREVLGYPLAPSVRATVVPSGSNLLGVDEVGVPTKLAKVLLKAPNITDEELDSVLKKTWFWIKRDPVLHRWGLMPVRARIIEGNVIRLPASFLGPMGADFDGDIVAMFENTMIKSVGDYNKLLSKLACSKKEFGDISDIKMLYPKKQYLFGLYKLINDETIFKNFVDCLGKDFSELGNFKCVDELCVDEFLNKWVALAGDNKSEESNGKYWGILEEHALLALSEEPDMGLGLFDFNEIKGLPVIKCGAAKEIADKLEHIFEGKSLDSYSNPPIVGCSDDPIANVMVKSKIVVSKFGGVLRRLIYNIPETKIEPEIIAKAQALAEYITQKVLSVKAGEKPVSYEPYAEIIKNLISREPSPKIEDLKENLKETDLEKYVDFLKSFKKDFGTSKSESWLEWLREPHILKDIYETLKEEYISTKEDMRIGAWLES